MPAVRRSSAPPGRAPIRAACPGSREQLRRREAFLPSSCPPRLAETPCLTHHAQLPHTGRGGQHPTPAMLTRRQDCSPQASPPASGWFLGGVRAAGLPQPKGNDILRRSSACLEVSDDARAALAAGSSVPHLFCCSGDGLGPGRTHGYHGGSGSDAGHWLCQWVPRASGGIRSNRARPRAIGVAAGPLTVGRYLRRLPP